MRVFSKSTLRKFYEKHAKCEIPLTTWYKVASKAKWQNFADIKKDFNHTDLVKGELFVFDIMGNNYRLVADINFKKQSVFIKFIGTHAAYDKKNFKK